MKPYQHTVQYYETDKMGITHHSNYIRWMEEARVDFLEQLGWSFPRLEAAGIVSPVTEVSCKYLRSTKFADTVTITAQVAALTGARLSISYEMTDGAGNVLCRATSGHCFLDENGRVLRLKQDCPGFYAALAALLPEAKK